MVHIREVLTILDFGKCNYLGLKTTKQNKHEMDITRIARMKISLVERFKKTHEECITKGHITSTYNLH